MQHIRQVFVVLSIELILIAVLGFMTVDNNLCDTANSWHWSYYGNISNQSTSQCGMINVSVQSSEARFYALNLVLLSVPVTVIYGLIVSTKATKKISKSKPRDEDSN